MSELRQRILEGIQGKYIGLSNGFTRLNKYIYGIQKKTYYLLGGQSGTFKTTLADYMVLNALEDAEKRGINLKVFYYSFEIDKLTKECNWLSIVINQKYGKIIPPEKIKGFRTADDSTNVLTKEEMQLVFDCIPDMEMLFDKIHFEFVPINPTGIFHQIWSYFKENGTFEYKDYIDKEGKAQKTPSKYIPNNPDDMVLGVVDHLIKIKNEREDQGWTKKQVIDKHSEYCIQTRNMFGMSWLNIQQFNRALSSVERKKFSGVDLSPSEADFKDSGDPYQDADVVLGTMCPYKLEMEKSLGYDVEKLGEKYINLKIIKNRLGPDNRMFALYARPEYGSFEELPNAKEINYEKYTT